MFEEASRLKLRFPSPAGNLSVEDLWDLPLTSKVGHANLDDIAKKFSKVVADNEESFVEKPAPKNATNILAFEIVKHIIKVKLEEREIAKAAVDKKQKRDKIMDILARKQDASLEAMDEAELKKLLGEL
jgi:hypothetical protein